MRKKFYVIRKKSKVLSKKSPDLFKQAWIAIKKGSDPEFSKSK